MDKYLMLSKIPILQSAIKLIKIGNTEYNLFEQN